MLKSSPDVERAIDLIFRVRGLCAAGCFNLTKFISNNVEEVQAISNEHVRKNFNLKKLEKPKNQSGKEMRLIWNIDTDACGYSISMQDKPLSKRVMLSELSSVHDPLGLVTPFLLHGIKIIVSDEVGKDWVEWNSKLQVLENLGVLRCIKPAEFGKIKGSSFITFWMLLKEAMNSRLIKTGGWSRENSLCFTDRRIKSLAIEIFFHTKNGTNCCNIMRECIIIAETKARNFY